MQKMDQKRLLLAIAISVGILLIFELWNRPAREAERQQAELRRQQTTEQTAPTPAAPAAAATGAPGAAAEAAPTTPAVRIPIEGPRVKGAINLRGARVDEIVLKDYRETVNPNSPLVRVLEPRDTPTPYWAQWGWTAADGRTRVPGNETDWQAEGSELAPGRPVTLRWDNGQGQVFEIVLALDDNYMVTAEQRVRNSGAEPVQLQPWARIRREYKPTGEGYAVLHEGFTGVLDGRLRELTYDSAKSEAEKRAGSSAGGIAQEQETNAGWLGITDKYWLTALAVVDPAQRYRGAYRFVPENGQPRFQADLTTVSAATVAPGGTTSLSTRLFSGAKEVRLLDRYRDTLGIPDFDKAIDFGWFYFLTRPFFFALDYLFLVFGNFGVAILVFTLCLKILFFPLANKAYKSMARMKVLGPKMQEIKARYKDDPAKSQAEMMALYRSEKVNPASGCLPILIQIPVFFALYKVLLVTIEMRHAPFFGWIRDLSAPDPSNLFNLFGLLPFDPAAWSPYFHMPAWAIVMGGTMWLQYKLNPTPPDPVQAKIFAWMPLIFTFMLAGFPAGLVIYWTWNNLLSIGQQWSIMRMDRGRQAASGAAIPPPAKAKKG